MKRWIFQLSRAHRAPIRNIDEEAGWWVLTGNRWEMWQLTFWSSQSCFAISSPSKLKQRSNNSLPWSQNLAYLSPQDNFIKRVGLAEEGEPVRAANLALRATKLRWRTTEPRQKKTHSRCASLSSPSSDAKATAHSPPRSRRCTKRLAWRWQERWKFSIVSRREKRAVISH